MELMYELPGGIFNYISFCVAVAPDLSHFAYCFGIPRVFVKKLTKCKSSFSVQNSSFYVKLEEPAVALTFGLCHDNASDHFKPVVNTRFSFRNCLILAVGLLSGRISIVDVLKKKLLMNLADHNLPITDLKFALDGSLRLASCSRDTTIKLWNMHDDGNMYATLSAHKTYVNAVCWSHPPNCNLLCSVGCKKTAIIWDVSARCVKFFLRGHHHDVTACMFSFDNALIATASADSRVVLWNSSSGHPIREFFHSYPPLSLIHSGGENNYSVFDVAFVDNGDALITTCKDMYLRKWNLDSSCPHEPEEKICIPHCMNCPTFLNGSYILTGTRTGCIKIFHMPSNVRTLKKICRTVLNKHMTADSVEHLLPPQLMNFVRYLVS